MRHIKSLEVAELDRPAAVTIGAFDGMHRGHQSLIGQFVEHASANDLAPVVLTFYPLPRMVIGGFEPGFYLTLPDDRAALLGTLGVELVITHPFNDEVRHIRAAAFVDRLREHLDMRALWVGADFAMGYRREGNVEFLQAEGRRKGFDVRVVDLMDAGSERVSSSRVRVELAVGNVEEAARLLGRPHFVRGEVVSGDRRGSSLGIPTANLAVPVELAVPLRGVYAGWAGVQGALHPAVVNIGLRPTFDGAAGSTVETHLLDFSGDLYGHPLTLYFTARLREERKFAGVDALVTQIRADISRARELLPGTEPVVSVE